MLDVEGYDTTLGFTHKRHQPAAKDASLVSLIRQVRNVLLDFVMTTVLDLARTPDKENPSV